jgi:signal transduction histidine kinase
VYAKTATEISLTCHEGPEGLALVFCDNGPGIVPKMKEKIFERHYEKKRGISLFLAREILSITGITIHETGDTGTGARFEILVPKGGYRFVTPK